MHIPACSGRHNWIVKWQIALVRLKEMGIFFKSVVAQLDIVWHVLDGFREADVSSKFKMLSGLSTECAIYAVQHHKWTI